MLVGYCREVKSTQEPFRETKVRCKSQKEDLKRHYNYRHTQHSDFFTMSFTCLLIIFKVKLEVNTYKIWNSTRKEESDLRVGLLKACSFSCVLPMIFNRVPVFQVFIDDVLTSILISFIIIPFNKNQSCNLSFHFPSSTDYLVITKNYLLNA